MAGLMLADRLARGVRWSFLMPVEKRDFRSVILPLSRLETIGLAVNNILPFRLGELARTFLTSLRFKIPIVTVLATIVMERVFDVTGMLFILVFFADWGAISVLGGNIRRAGQAALVGLIAFLVLTFIFKERLAQSKFLEGIRKSHPFIGRSFDQALLGMRSQKDLKTLVMLLAMSLALWLMNALQSYYAAAAMGIGSITYSRAVTLLSSVGAAVTLPAVPGYFGTWEFIVTKVMVYWGESDTLGFGFASFLHLASYIWLTLLGLIFLYVEGHSLTSIKRALESRMMENK